MNNHVLINSGGLTEAQIAGLNSAAHSIFIDNKIYNGNMVAIVK